MKPGWKTAKFKDVSTIIGGSTPKTDIPEYWGGDNYWVAPAELDGSMFISSTVKRITDLAVSKTNLSLLPQGTVLLSSRAPIGKVAITTVPMYCNQGFKNIVCGPELFNGYVYYFLKHNVSYLQSLGTGATFKEVSKKVVENVFIAFPSLEEQHRIVDEMDLLTSIIDNKNAQLRDLDALAQSLFYEMFGNPQTNELCWQSMEFKDAFRLKSGDGLKEKEFIPGAFPVYGGNGISGYHNAFNKSGKHIIVGRVGAYCGNVRYVDDQFWLTDNAFDAFFDPSVFDYQFVCTLLNLLDLHQFANHAAQPVISNSGLKQLSIIIPPINIQVHFAERLSVIDSQKALIRDSLTQTQHLLNSRMDCYFND